MATLICKWTKCTFLGCNVKDANGNPFNLAGYTARVRISESAASTRTRQDFTTTIASDAKQSGNYPYRQHKHAGRRY